MMAIRISGIGSPPSLNAKTSLGFGQGTVVDIRAVMYDSRKQLKMNVSLRRKSHIMPFPHDAVLNTRWSYDQSVAKPSQPSARLMAVPVTLGARSAIGW